MSQWLGVLAALLRNQVQSLLDTGQFTAIGI